jgi:hypothetical protein
MSRLPGPRRLPARVYWRRRLVLLTLACALAYGVAQLLGGGSGEQAARPVGAASTPHPSGPSSLPTPTQAAPTANTQNTASASSTPLAVPSGPCADDDVQVTPAVDPVQPGVPVVITLDLTTLKSPACTWRVSPRSVVLKVTSGSDGVWSTQDCPSHMPTESVVLRHDHHVKVHVTWQGRRSDGSCGRSAGWARPGSYQAEAAALGAEPQDVSFQLVGNTPATVTAHPKPKHHDHGKHKGRDNGQKTGQKSGQSGGASPTPSAGPSDKPTKTD